MTVREHRPGANFPEFSQQRKLNQQRYEELMGLLEGRASAEITTETHRIEIKPEEGICVREGGCLEIDITPLNTGREYPLTFNYHINHSEGIVGVGIDGTIVANEFGIPGGGSIYFFTDWNDIGDDKEDALDLGKLSGFIMEQATVGTKTFEEPGPDPA